MIDRRFFLEAGTLVASAVVCALVANAIASTSRKVELVGDYPQATSVRPKAGASGATGAVGGGPGTAAALASPGAPDATPAAAAASGGGAAPLSAQALAARFPPHPGTPWVEIGSDDADVLHRAGASFLDARRTDVYAEGHIPGSWSLPVWEADLDAKLDAFLGTGVAPEDPIVVYCAGGECEDSHMLSERLLSRGFSAALVYKDGFPDWEKKGRAVTKGAERGTR